MANQQPPPPGLPTGIFLGMPPPPPGRRYVIPPLPDRDGYTRVVFHFWFGVPHAEGSVCLGIFEGRGRLTYDLISQHIDWTFCADEMPSGLNGVS